MPRELKQLMLEKTQSSGTEIYGGSFSSTICLAVYAKTSS